MLDEIEVINRDGGTELLDIKKIQEKTSKACEGLEGVSQSELEVDAGIQFRNGITTEEIQETIIHTAVDKIDVECPNWTFVAARLFIYDLYHRVGKNIGGTKGQPYCHLRKYFEIGEKLGRIVLGLKEKYNIEDLNSYIKPERDLNFNYLGVKTLYDRYLIKDRANLPIELPQQMFMAIGMFLAQNEKDCQGWAKKFYDVLSNFEVMSATPTLSNARTPRHQLSSCFIGAAPDNIEGIFDGYKEMALLSKFGGGIGWDWTSVRSQGSFIDGHKSAAGGIVPFLKITNDLAVAVDQLGTRKGAIAIYIEPWHMDVEDFIDLKKNSGEERRRTHDLFPSLWINDLFMERVESNGQWTLFDPFHAPELKGSFGEEFKAIYEKYEQDPKMPKRVMTAKELWKKILLCYFESGSPFLCFKDTANRANPNSHAGVIRSSNLCTEIFQNTAPNTYQVNVKFVDGTSIQFNEDESITTESGLVKKANKLTSLDRLENKEIFIVEKEAKNGLTAVCNLASINLSRVNTQKDLERVVPIAVRMLDNVINLNFYPAAKVKETNLLSRSIGLGVMGEAQWLAESRVYWGSQEHLEMVDEVMELISYHAINTSCDLAVEKGSYPTFAGSKWSKGIFPIDTAKKEAKELTKRNYNKDWEALRTKVKKNGMRNGYLMAIAPTSSISILTGTTQTIEPIYKRKWFEENLSGLIPVTAPNISPYTNEYYISAYDLDQRDLVRAAAVRQKWMDQGQSLNIFVRINQASGKTLNEIYTLAWKLGCKSTYYLRSESAESKEDVADRSAECVGCQ